MAPQEHKYENVRLASADHDDSSTEVEESLMGDEKQWTDGLSQRALRRSRTTQAVSVFRKYRWLIDTSLLATIVGLLVLLLKAQQPTTSTGSRLDFTSDLTGFAPRMRQQIVRFQPDHDYLYAPNDTSKFFTTEVLERWNQLMPIGMGFQWVKDPSKYDNLPTPIVWPEKTVFTTSVTHQIHCLFTIVQTYSGLKSNHSIPDDHHWHMIHCFDYLRQAILCNSDLALEGLETTFPDHNGGSDGWDAKHVCKDYSQVKDYLESVRAYDDRQIY